MRVFIERAFNGINKFLKNPLERKFVFLSIFYGSKKRYQKKAINILGINFKVPDTLSFIWQFKEIFVEEYYRFDTTNNTPVILDCGANIGTSVIYFKKLYPNSKIIAFEANPGIAGILKGNLNANNIGDVEVIEKAVWINNEGIEIGVEDSDASSIYKEENKTNVPSVRLKEYLEKEKHIEMLKIDIEGAESEVLKDCKDRLSNISNMFIEYHSYLLREQNLGELLSILEENGFRYYVKANDDRNKPLMNRKIKSNPEMDLQLNIFAYRTK